MNHFAPHPGAQFEGYYSKFDLPSGARLALIITNVPNAKDRPHLVSFTYYPQGSNDYFQREISIDSMEMVKTSTSGAFRLDSPGVGTMTVDTDGKTVYAIEHADFQFHATTTSHFPWSSTTSTPEGSLVYLPLPLHWHVQSLGSECTFDLSIPSYKIAAQDAQGTAKVHQEKNWATSFPSAHIWLQARSEEHVFCAAGGQIIGTEAYLLGFRSKKTALELDFRPPYATKVLGLSPTLVATPEFEKRRMTLSASSWTKKIEVVATADPETFFPLSAPFEDGHRDNFLAQSFRAELRVKVSRWRWGPRWWDVRGWWVGREGGSRDVGWWEIEEEVTFQDASLEFGGEYYPFAGSETKRAR